MKLYVIRHGQSEANLGGFHSGNIDVALTEEGERDAACAGRLLAGIPFDRVYASDFLRARQTARIALPSAEIEVLPLIREIAVGRLEGKRFTECQAEYGESYTENRRRADFRPYGGESLGEMSLRSRAFIEMLRGLPASHVAAFSHAGFLSTLLSIAVGADPMSRGMTVAENGSVSVFEITENDFKLLSWSHTGKLPL